MELEMLRPEHYQRLKPCFAGPGLPLSTYSLASLIMWSQCIFDTLFAVEGDAVFIAEMRMDDPHLKHLLLPVSPGQSPPPGRLRAQAEAAGFKEYHCVPESYLAEHGRDEMERLFVVTEQKEFEDYVYRAADLAGLTGRDYAKKRNLIRQFEREYVEPGRVEARSLSRDNGEECLACMEGWREARLGKDWTDVLECERGAITCGLKNFDALELQGLAVLVDGRVRGFGIGSRLKDDTWVLNFEKAADQVKGLYQYLDRECCRRLFPGVEFVNKESDMGDPGLARAKQSYYPAFRVKSYKLELR